MGEEFTSKAREALGTGNAIILNLYVRNLPQASKASKDIPIEKMFEEDDRILEAKKRILTDAAAFVQGMLTSGRYQGMEYVHCGVNNESIGVIILGITDEEEARVFNMDISNALERKLGLRTDPGYVVVHDKKYTMRNLDANLQVQAHEVQQKR